MSASGLTIWDYSGIVAAAYDEFFGAEPFWDQAFFFERIRGNDGPALELACGTGRLLVPYLRDGLEVEGLDTSEDMLALLLAKAQRQSLAPVLHRAPMQAFDLPGRFRTVFCPAGSFRILLEDDEILASLRCCLRALQPGGELLIPFDVTPPAAEDAAAWRERRHVRVPSYDADVRIFERNEFDAARSLVYWFLRWEVERGGRTEVFFRDHALRHHTVDGFTALLQQAGFKSVQTRRGYTDPPSSDRDEDIVFSARRP